MSTYSKDRTLLHWNVLIRRRGIHVTVKASKTDPFGKGACLLITPTHHSICPVPALKRYLAKSPLWSPIQTQEWQVPNTQRSIPSNQKGLRKNGINPKQYSSDSFCIGAASTDGIPDSMIKTL